MLRRTFVTLITAAALSRKPTRKDQAFELRHHLDRVVDQPEVRLAAVIDDLSRAIGVLPVKPFFASDYAGIIEGMRFNKVQLGWFGNKSAIEAVDRAKGEVFASVIDKDGNPGYCRS